MSRRRQLGLSLAGGQFISIALFSQIIILAPTCAPAQEPEARIAAHLAAGDFQSAKAIARNAPNQGQHDAWLGQIAAAQARAGSSDEALLTAGEIYDDRARVDALAGVMGRPRGGGTMADFDALIDLITTTIEPTTWDTVGGPGSIAPFPTGVYIDARGLVQEGTAQAPPAGLATLREASAPGGRGGDARRASPLRKVSLPRLERHVRLLQALGRQPTETMQVLAGLERVEYVFVYPECGELVLAGPASDWTLGPEGRVVATASGRPLVRLDDLVVVLRQLMGAADARFGCLITPRQEGLARVQEVLSRPAPALRSGGQRNTWLEQLRGSLGVQDIEVYGLDPTTRAAAVMVEADYRMKLVGMGLEDGTPGLKSYLEMVEVPPPPMSVLRWWFTLDYEAVVADADHLAFAFRGQGLKVLSENELLTAEGERVHTGRSEALNRRFAESFTEHFGDLCDKYPVYAELRNLADLAIVGALVREEGLAERIGWGMTCFGPAGSYAPLRGRAPRQIHTVANCRVIRDGNQVHTLAGVSGGVRIDAAPLVARGAMEIDRYGKVAGRRATAAPENFSLGTWWWD